MITGEIDLLYKEQKIISDGDWLTDRIIDAVQNVLRLAHPHIGGLQSTILGETLTFDIQRGNFVQVLNVSRSHWITISNIGCEPETIAIYDSLGSGSVPARTSEQIAAIVFSSSSSIQLIFKSVQMQSGGSDCGLFALAFATSLSKGEKPEEINYMQHQFRQHLQNCIVAKQFTLFPRTSRKKKPVPPISETSLQLFCKCCLPDTKKERMACCDHCGEWYHEHCVMIPDTVWSNKYMKWYCGFCK